MGIRWPWGGERDWMSGYVLVSSLQRLDEQIAHLKDQLQELKAKTNLEAKYMKKESQVGLLETLGMRLTSFYVNLL